MNSMRVNLVAKLISVLESVLSKLGRYDEGSVIGSILSIAVSYSFPMPRFKLHSLVFIFRINTMSLEMDLVLENST